MMAYCISDNFSRAYILSKENINLELPKYKEAIFIFMNKDFHKLRRLILKEINSDDYDEELLLKKLKLNEINEDYALEKMLSYSIFKALNNVLNFIVIGEEIIIDDCLNLLNKYKNISLSHNFVDYWWVISSLEIIIKELYENSMWNQLKPFYSNTYEELNNKLTDYIRGYANSKNPIIELWPSQVNAIPKILENNDNLAIKMPTSSGKTFVAELLILKYYMQGHFYNNGKVIYISPFRSLSNEIEYSLHSSLKNLDLKVSEFYGGFDSNEYEKYYLDKLDVLIVTPEKFDILLRTNPQLKEEIGLIIVDEGHIMGTYKSNVDKYSVRSTKFEFFMYRLKNLFKNSRIVFISGVLSNIKDFSKWLSNDSTKLIDEVWKPTNIYVGALYWFKKEKGYIKYFYKNNKKLPETILNFMEYIPNNGFINSKRRNEFPANDNEALALSAIELSKDGQTYIYAPKKNEINPVARNIIKIKKEIKPEFYNCKLNIFNQDEDIIKLKEIIKEELGDNSELLNYLNYGFIIHHADLPNRVKIAIEKALKNKKIKLVIATSTLVQGINLPVKTIIFKGLYINKNIIDYSTFFNICGRVGRASKNNNGRVLLFLGNIDKNKDNYQKYELLSKFRNFFDKDDYQLKSIIEPILKKLKRKHKTTKYSINEYCLKLIEGINISKIFNSDELMNITEMDNQLLAFIEEEDEKDDLKILENFINVSLHHVQFKKSIQQDYLKGFINSRITYLKKEFSETNIRTRAYKSGLSLKDCKYIENNYEKIKELFFKSKKWNEYTKNEKDRLLLKIALTMLELDTLNQNNKIKQKNEILKQWISNKSLFEIISDKNLSESQINKFINFCKNMLPWAITSLLNYFKLKEPNLQMPKVCHYFSEMYKYGIFDLKIVILMPFTNNNYKLCKKLSNYFKIDQLNFNKIVDELKRICNELENIWSKEELKEFKKYLFLSPQYNKRLEIHINLTNNKNVSQNQFIYLLNNLNNISSYDLEGNYLFSIDYEDIQINNAELNIENVWEIKSIHNNNLLLKSVY